MQNLLAIVQTVGSLVLVGVTAWYAILTKGMARAAAESAESSKRAAEAAAKALTISAASVDVEFEISPAYSFGEQEEMGMTVRSAGRDLERIDGELPARIHRGEDLAFVITPPFANPYAEDGVALMEASVWYSLDGEGPAIERRVTFYGVVGSDYTDPGPGDIASRESPGDAD